MPSEELPILENLLRSRDQLTILKRQERENYVRTSDVLKIYNEALKQVKKLNDVRDEAQSSSSTEASTSQGSEAELNRVDYTLNDVFQLLSLFFLSIGKGRHIV